METGFGFSTPKWDWLMLCLAIPARELQNVVKLSRMAFASHD
jgi:hypothetical protein